MVYIRRRLEKESRQIVTARTWGVSLIAASFGVGFFLSEARRLGLSFTDPLNIAYLTLFLIVGGLVFLWIWATQKELEILFDWLDPKRYLPPSSLKETAIILGLACLLVALLYTSRNPLWFGVTFTAYSVCVPVATRYLNTQIENAIRGSKERIADELTDAALRPAALLYGEGVEEVEHYFLKTPQMTRFVLIACFAAAGTLLAALWQFGHFRSAGIGAYAILSSTILISEVVIFRWRLRRDRALHRIAVELAETVHDRA